MKFAVITGLVMLFSTTCEKRSTKETAIARVMDDYLYASDLVGVVAPGTLQADSVEAVHAYIHNWIQQKLLVKKAEQNLSDQQKNFEQEIENYRNSLVIFAYQNALIEQSLDTTVSEIEIQTYYEENKQQFLLKSNIVRVRFARLDNYPGNSKDREIKEKIKDNQTIEKLIFSQDVQGEDWMKLADLCQKGSSNYYLDGDRWIYFNDLLKEIPIELYNQEEFLRANKQFIVPEENCTYCVNILEFRVKESFSPFDFEREKIRTIILNNRKVKAIEDLRSGVMEEGQKNEWFEIF